MLKAPMRLVVALSLLVPIGAAAQEAAPPASDPGYDGVVPGESEVRPPGPRNPRAVYWIGFQPSEAGSSRVFVQLGSELDYQQWVTDDGELVVVLPGARLANSNAARPLDTRFFDTAIAGVDARRVGRRRGKHAHRAGIELRLRFKSRADAAVADASMREEKDGYTYLYLDFGPGSAPATPEADDAAEPSLEGDED